MATLLVRNAAVLVSMDGQRREIPDGGLFVRDGRIEAVGPSVDLPRHADEILDLRDHVVIPGLVNTHHHLYQTLTRAVPAVQDAGLFDWLRSLYPIWNRLRPDDVRISTLVGLAELALSGCSTASDHLYLFPNGVRLDHQIEAAAQVGLRFHASRGSMSLGESRGGLPPDSLVEDEEEILEDCHRVIELFHDPRPGSMTRIALAPCSPFSVTPELMRESAGMARRAGVRLHTHLAESVDEERFCLERFGKRPLHYAEDLAWVGSDVWLAHGVHVDRAGIDLLAGTGTGIAHCPTSNMRLASGVAPIQRFMAAGVPVGLGVDGSASNDTSNLLAEARQAMLLARLAVSLDDHREEELMSVRTALELATLGGASVLGREDIGSLEPGKRGDFTALSLDRLPYAGALHDPVAALLLCHPATVDYLYVEGRPVVERSRLVSLELATTIEQHNAAAARLVSGSSPGA